MQRYQLIAEIAQQLRENAFSVIILDEIEKASPKVLESLLKLMSSERFTSYELSLNNERTRAIELSARNASVLMTSNAGSREMHDYFANLSSNDRNVSRESLSNNIFNRKWLKNTANAAGVPEPLIDRVDIIEAAYPPTEGELVEIINLHKKHIQSYVQAQMKLEIDYYGISELIDYYLDRYSKEEFTKRDLLKELHIFLKHRSSEILMHTDFGKNNIGYKVNLSPHIPDSHSISSFNKCVRFYEVLHK